MGKSIVNIGFNERKRRPIERAKKGRIVFKDNTYGIHTFRDNEKKIDSYEFEREIDPYNMQQEISKAYDDKTYKDGAVFHSKTKNNMYWVNGEWLVEGESGKFQHKNIYNKHLQMYEDIFSKQQTGMTLKDIKKEVINRMSLANLTNLEEKRYKKELNNIWSLNEANILLEKHGVERILSAKKGYSRDREISFADEMSKRKFSTTYVLSVSDELLIKNDYYKPIYDFVKHSGSGEKIVDPHTKEEIKYWGVEEVDFNKFRELGDTYIEYLIEWKKGRHGELPFDKNHIISATWHFDEKTPHLHIEASNISYKEYQRNKEREKRMSVVYGDEFSKNDEFKMYVKMFRNGIWERLKERHFPELAREVPMQGNREMLSVREYREKWREQNNGIPLLRIGEVDGYFKKEEEKIMNKMRNYSFEGKLLYKEILVTFEQNQWGLDKEIGFRERWMNLGMPLSSYETLIQEQKQKQLYKEK